MPPSLWHEWYLRTAQSIDYHAMEVAGSVGKRHLRHQLECAEQAGSIVASRRANVSYAAVASVAAKYAASSAARSKRFFSKPRGGSWSAPMTTAPGRGFVR